MKDKLLTIGDVIELKKGMKVYSQMEERYTYDNKPFSEKPTNAEIEIGVFKKVAGFGNINKSLESTAKDIKEAFISNLGLNISTTIANNFINSQLPDFAVMHLGMKRFTVYPGEYVVTRTQSEGGSNNGIDPYPDGHRVFAKKLSIHGTYNSIEKEISFYQSGCFTCMILPSDIQSIRRLEPTFQ